MIRQRAARGFTLLELTVTMLLLSLVLVGVLTLFDQSNKMTLAQLNRIDTQQSARIAQREMSKLIRLAGRGGLPASSTTSSLPTGLALAIDNNVTSRQILTGINSPDVADDTDVLTVRGVISSPVYLVRFADPTTYTFNAGAGTGTVRIDATTPIGNRVQDLRPLAEAIGTNRPEAVVLVSPFSDEVYGVAELLPGGSVITPNPTNPQQIVLAFRITNGTHTAEYTVASSDGVTDGVFPAPIFNTSRVGTVGILEEYRFYIRRGREIETPTAVGDQVLRLSMARAFPGVEDTVYPDDPFTDLADNIQTLQVAFGFDLDGDGIATESDDGTADEILGNHPSDDSTAAPWPPILNGPASELSFVRVSTVSRSTDPQRDHIDPIITQVEDILAFDPPGGVDLIFQRVLLSTHVDVRNL